MTSYRAKSGVLVFRHLVRSEWGGGWLYRPCREQGDHGYVTSMLGGGGGRFCGKVSSRL